MPTLTVLTRSLFAFIVVAAVAVGGFVVSDTRPLSEAVANESTGSTASSQSVPQTAPEAEDVTTPSTQVPPAPTTASPAIATPVPITSLDQLPQTGSGSFVPARTTNGITLGSGNIIEFSVAAEQGSGVDPDELAAQVDQVLQDQRSWIAEGNIGFRRIETGGLFTLVVATAGTVDQLCSPLRTNGIFSCAHNGWIALNLNRWELATNTWTSNLAEYRNYVINHEVGHYLSRPHVGCPGVDQLAPVMMQQTKGLGDCQRNGWPYPDGLNP